MNDLNILFNPRKIGISDGWLTVICIFLSLAFLLLDLVLPLGVAGGVPYVLVILVSLSFTKSSPILRFALLCSILVTVGFFYSPRGGELWIVLLNRFLAMFAIWVTALLGFLHKKNNQQLLESEARFLFMANTAPLLICLLNEKCQLTFLSLGLQNILTGKSGDELLPVITEKLHIDDKQEFVSQMASSFEKQTELQHECRLLNDKGEYRWFLIQATPRFTQAGDFAGYINTFMDITDKKRSEYELEKMRNINYYREKMAEIGTLSAGIIHEVGNPVAAIYGLTQAILDASEEGRKEDLLGHQAREDVIAILEQTERLMGITNEVMSFVAVGDGDGEIFDVNELVKTCCRLMNYDAKMKNIDLSYELIQEAPALNVNKDHITQILLNLLSNAAHACINIKEPSIRVETHQEGEFFVIKVNDNGCGMTAEVASRAVEPFYTTKPIGQGTGLGLAMCKALVEQHKGQLKIESKLGGGTRVDVVLPIGDLDSAIQAN